jgi:hypothetical protein
MISKIEEALSKPSDSEVILAIEKVVYGKFNTEEEFSLLTKSEKAFIYISILESQVNNGGFHQYFFNSTGDDAYKALEAYKEIGSLTTTNIVQRAIELFPQHSFPKSTHERRNLLETMNNSIVEEWDKLDDEFYKYDEDIINLMIDFVKRNISDFR